MPLADSSAAELLFVTLFSVPQCGAERLPGVATMEGYVSNIASVQCNPVSTRSPCAGRTGGLLAAVLLLLLLHFEMALSDEGTINGDGLGGIITDQTITFLGHDFYSGFSHAWEPPDEMGEVNLTIYERPSARWGSLIWVEYRNETVYRTFLFPGRTDAESMGASAAAAVAAQVEQQRLEKLLYVNPDLASSELWDSPR